MVAVISLLQPRQYVATAEFLLQEPSSSMSGQGLAQIASQLGVASTPGSGPSGYFYAEWIRSFEIMRDASRISYKAINNSDLYSLFEIDKERREADSYVVRALRKHVRTRYDRVLSTVNIEVQFENPALASEIGRQLLNLLNVYGAQRRMTVGRTEREFVGRRLSNAQDSLAISEKEYAEFILTNRRLSESPELSLRATRIQRRISQHQATVQLLNQQYEAARLQELRDTPVMSVVQRPEETVEPVARGTAFKTAIAFVTALLFQLIWSIRKAAIGRSETVTPKLN